MPVKLTAKHAGLTDSEVAAVEQNLGLKFPESYRQFLTSGNVLVAAPNRFIGQGISGSIMKFLGVSANSDDDLNATLNLYDSRIPVGTLPIALAGGGNLICINLKDGSIYFWDHEQEAGEGELVSFNNMHRLADSLGQFLDGLSPFDPDSVTLRPSDVLSVKLKPGFAEKFKDYK